MTEFVRAAAYAASQKLSDLGVRASRSHLGEVMASLLGYETYAALSTEEADVSLEYHLEDAELLVLDDVGGLARGTLLLAGRPEAEVRQVLVACEEALTTAASHARVFTSIAAFYDDYVYEALVDAVESSPDVADSQAESNAHFTSNARFPPGLPEVERLWSARQTWSLEADGSRKGQYDPEGDRMFNGDTLICRAKLNFQKAGRAGLIFDDSEAYGGIDDDWRAQDYEQEAEYEAFLRSK